MKKFHHLVILAVGCLLSIAPSDSSDNKQNKSSITPVLLNQVQIDDSFWSPKLKVYTEQTIPHSWHYVEDAVEEAHSHIVGAPKEVMKGFPWWQESNLYKHLEAVTYSLHQFPDETLKAKLDSVLEIFAKAQRDNGYLYVFGMTRGYPEWEDIMMSHEDFNIGHLYEAAAFHSQFFDKSFLDIAANSANHAYKLFIEDHCVKGCPGHGGMELGLVELYRQTKDVRHLNLAIDLIERRGKGLNGWDCEKIEELNRIHGFHFPCEYFQDHLPFEKQTRLRGHAVRGIYFLTAIVDVAIETGKPEYIAAAKRLWESLITHDISITGSIGAFGRYEDIGERYDIPINSYNESCAACGMANCAAKMLRLEPSGKHADMLEDVLYNGILHGISLDGKSFFAQNPLNGNKQRGNDNWVCCPPNVSRTLLGIGRYIYTKSEDHVYVNLYIGNKSKIKLKNIELDMNISGDYTWNGEAVIKPNPSRSDEFSLSLRIPSWCENYKIHINNEEQKFETNNGYITITRKWEKKDVVKINFDMEVYRMMAHPSVNPINQYKNTVALRRGPVIYAIEGIDNNNTTDVTIAEEPNFLCEFKEDLHSGIVTIEGKTTENKNFLAIPYFALANRNKSNSDVWIQQEGKTNNNNTNWEGKLYQKYLIDINK
jgi:DUF1680 family protein